MIRLTEEKHRLLKEKMTRIDGTNQEAFLRKMALDGLIIKLDLPKLKQMISLLRYTSNNINQISKLYLSAHHFSIAFLQFVVYDIGVFWTKFEHFLTKILFQASTLFKIIVKYANI